MSKKGSDLKVSKDLRLVTLSLMLTKKRCNNLPKNKNKNKSLSQK